MDVLLATGNPSKVEEYRYLLKGTPLNLRTLQEFSVPDVEEPFETFAENAQLKAENAMRHTGLPTLADDSGFCIAGLQGKPGVKSARFAQKQGGFHKAFRRLEESLGEEPSSAYFVCALAFSQPRQESVVFVGQIDGEVVFPPRGSQGLGYDPIFLPQGHQRTFGEMSMPEKHHNSHRQKAVQQFLEFFCK